MNDVGVDRVSHCELVKTTFIGQEIFVSSVTTQTKEKYEKALDELSNCTPQYVENMKQVFAQCQHFEDKRLSFLREVLLDVKHHLNLAENQRSAAY